MDLIERYLAAVGRQLPAKQAPDIEAELRDVLMTRVEEQEERLGRPLNRPELEGLLVAFGHPLSVAGRYRTVQHLIGPDIYPFWWAALKLTLGVMVVVFLVLAVLGIAAQSPADDFRRAMPSLWTALCIGFTSVTLVAAALEHYPPARAALLTWRPARLPPPHRKVHTAFERIVEVVASAIFLAWWFGAFRFRDWIPYSDFLRVDLAPVWTDYRWWIASYLIAEMAVNVVGLARPTAVRLNGVLGVARNLYGAGLAWAVLQAGHFVVLSSERIPAAALSIAQRNFDKGFYAGLVATVALMIGRAAWEAWRMWRDAPRAQGDPAKA